ncbi:MAG: DUF1893 domain-containing protein [Clostridia bacterium]|nr:DUF1893 domain-containing protein [Clostridia bacterium]
MTDIETARKLLESKDCSVVLCKECKTIEKFSRGIAPLMEIIDSGEDVSGFSAADKIVGKAAAMLFSYMNIKEVYGEVMSRLGYEYLCSKNIPATYTTLTENIINRKGDGICPMEKTVTDIIDERFAVEALRQKIFELKSNIGE